MYIMQIVIGCSKITFGKEDNLRFLIIHVPLSADHGELWEEYSIIIIINLYRSINLYSFIVLSLGQFLLK